MILCQPSIYSLIPDTAFKRSSPPPYLQRISSSWNSQYGSYLGSVLHLPTRPVLSAGSSFYAHISSTLNLLFSSLWHFGILPSRVNQVECLVSKFFWLLHNCSGRIKGDWTTFQDAFHRGMATLGLVIFFTCEIFLLTVNHLTHLLPLEMVLRDGHFYGRL